MCVDRQGGGGSQCFSVERAEMEQQLFWPYVRWDLLWQHCSQENLIVLKYVHFEAGSQTAWSPDGTLVISVNDQQGCKLQPESCAFHLSPYLALPHPTLCYATPTLHRHTTQHSILIYTTFHTQLYQQHKPSYAIARMQPTLRYAAP